MPDVPRTLGVITARGGSRGIPQKNIAPLLGRPLIAYTIDAARDSALTRCIVSTDDNAIGDVARSLGADVPFLRPADLATDNAGSVDVVRHALAWCREQGEMYDYAMILQPTSPLRTAADIDACLEIAAFTGADSVMSMVELADFALQKLKHIDADGRIHALVDEEGPQSSRRDAHEPVYKRNTAIYLTKTDVLGRGDLFGDDSRAFIMPRERSVDINDATDLDLAAFFLQRT